MDEPVAALSELSFNTLLSLAECYEYEPTNTHQYDLLTAIQTLLLQWADSVPQEMRSLLRGRITRPIEYIQTRTFHLDYIWLNAKELCVHYETDAVVEMIVSITPTYILVKDTQFAMREAAFPLLQPSMPSSPS
jgi:hypothetical protein